jgi:hypothetical protein
MDQRNFHNPAIGRLALLAAACGATMMAAGQTTQEKVAQSQDKSAPTVKDTTQPGDTPAPSLADLQEMDKKELREEAERRGILVTGEGSSEPTRNEYLKALAPRDEAAAQQRFTDAKSQKLDQTIPGGRFQRADGTWENSYGEEIDQKSGKLKDKEAQSRVPLSVRYS